MLTIVPSGRSIGQSMIVFCCRGGMLHLPVLDGFIEEDQVCDADQAALGDDLEDCHGSLQEAHGLSSKSHLNSVHFVFNILIRFLSCDLYQRISNSKLFNVEISCFVLGQAGRGGQLCQRRPPPSVAVCALEATALPPLGTSLNQSIY